MGSLERTPPEPSAENGSRRGSLFAVTREGGARWDHARPPHDQDGWDEHLAFMGGSPSAASSSSAAGSPAAR
jgi:hypothetical protein